MDLKEYRYFIAIVNNGNISKAAEKLYISQPSLSVYLKHLEERVGVPLLEKKGAKMVMTYEGELFYDYASKMVALHEECMNTLRSVGEEKRGLIRIGVTPSRSSYLTPFLHEAITEAYPHVQLEICEWNNQELMDGVRKGEIDLALLSSRVHLSELNEAVIVEEEVVLVAREGDPIDEKAIRRPESRHPWIPVCEVSQRQLVLLTPGRSLRKAAESMFIQDQCSAQIAYETQSILTCLEMVEKSGMLSFIYDSSMYMHDFRGLKMYSVGTSPIKTRFVLLSRKAAPIHPLKKEIYEYVYQILQKRFSEQI